MKQTIVLKFHTVEHDTGRYVVAEAVDLETHDPVASYSLLMMHAWLKRHGYRWRVGSSGIFDRVA